MTNSEEKILCQIFLKPDLVHKINLSPEEFGDNRCKAVYKVILGLSSEDKPIDFLSVKAVMPELDSAWLAQLTDLIPSAANYKHYVDEIKKDCSVRQMENLLSEAKELMFSAEPTEVRNLIEQRLAEIDLNTSGFEVKGLADVITASVDKIEQRFRSRGTLPGIDTGFPSLNDYTLGFQPRLLYLFAARPSRGKTALMLNMAVAGAKEHRVGIISTESANEELGVRLISSVANIDSQRLNSGYINKADFAKMMSSAGNLCERNIYFYDEPNASIDTVIYKIKEMVRSHKVECVYVDYVQNIECRSEKSEHENVGKVSGMLKATARRLNIPVVALAQLRRESEGMYSRPTQKDLLGSGKLEQDADFIGLLWWQLLNKEDYKNGDRADFRRWLCADKNRDGIVGDIPMVFSGNTVTFREKQ